MNPSVTLVEVVGRSEQGMTLPFLCRGEDDRLYYVKGRYAGQLSLCCEWIAGNLAQSIGLRMPDFAIAEVPKKLVDGSDRPDIQDLGEGLVFASARLEEAREITWPEAGTCDEWMRALVLLVDWWVHNEDRQLTALGGNPNLLLTGEGPPPGLLWTFDFNAAFESDFDSCRFWENHIFANLQPDWPDGFRAFVEPRMHAALDRVDEWFASLPVEWQHLLGDENLPVQLEPKVVIETLTRAFATPDAFWNRS